MSKNPVPTTAKPDLEGLRNFANETGRLDPPSFVGREEILDNFARDLRSRAVKWRDRKDENWENAWQSPTWLFQGAPGAGKTALLAQIRKDAVARKKAGAGFLFDGLSPLLGRRGKSRSLAVKAIKIDSGSDFHILWDMKVRVAKAIHPKKGAKLEELVSIDKTYRLKGFERTTSFSRVRKQWDEFVGEVQGNPNRFPILLVIHDEAQGLQKEARENLEWLHRGEHGLPVVPVFGGLAWTRKHFKAITPVLSRIDGNRAITLDKLPKKHCLEAVRKFLNKFRVVASVQSTEEWAQVIAEDCMGWPQHLHFSLQGMAWALLKPGVDGNLDRLNEQDLETARQYAEEQRNDYYSDRLASENLKGNRCLSGVAVSCLHSSGDSVSRATMQKKIRKVSDEAGGMGADNEFALPEETTPGQYVEGMIHAGILHEDKDGYLNVPIPCFHNYLLEKLEQWEQDRKAPSEPEETQDPGFSP